MSRNLQGRSYLTVAEAEEGMPIEVDGDFTCIQQSEKRQLRVVDGELGFDCDENFHSFIGQLSDDGMHYVGVYRG